jgi:DNA-binding XRE family transcriptional regulator
MTKDVSRPTRLARRASRARRRQRAPGYDALPRAFGNHLRGLRESQGLTQGDLAGPVLGRSAIAKLESGAATPSLQALAYLAWVLDVPMQALIPHEL